MRLERSNRLMLDSASQTALLRTFETFWGYELMTAPRVSIICKSAQQGGSVTVCQDTCQQ